MKGMLARGELFRVLEHALAPVRSHDSEDDVVPGLRHLIEVRVLHGAGMKGGDLVVVAIGRDEGLGRELRIHHPDVPQRQAIALHPLPVGREVPSHRGHR